MSQVPYRLRYAAHIVMVQMRGHNIWFQYKIRKIILKNSYLELCKPENFIKVYMIL